MVFVLCMRLVLLVAKKMYVYRISPISEFLNKWEKRLLMLGNFRSVLNELDLILILAWQNTRKSAAISINSQTIVQYLIPGKNLIITAIKLINITLKTHQISKILRRN